MSPHIATCIRAWNTLKDNFVFYVNACPTIAPQMPPPLRIFSFTLGQVKAERNDVMATKLLRVRNVPWGR